MKTLKKLHWLALLLFIAVACSSDPDIKPTPTPPDPIVPGIKEGFNINPSAPDADKNLTILFKAAKSSPLYGYTGDVYAHTGVVSEGTWMYVPADWNQNIAKCKMTKVEDNVWRIDYSPTIRQWFNSVETAINKIGIVVRSADGEKKGIADDYFVTVTDNKYKAFDPGAIKNAPQPGGLKHGINIVDNSTVTLVMYDKDKNGAHKDFAHVFGDFNDWTLSNTDKSQMYRDEATSNWWITITGLDSSKEYAFQYYVGTNGGETIRLADAYSRKILDPNNDQYISSATYPDNKAYPPKGAIGIVSVFKTVKDPYTWKVPNFVAPDESNMVIYEMLLRDFTTTGDINGAMQKLDYLQSLGVNVIELMPIQEFDGNDSWGYNPAFFFALDKAYGTDRMYKEFIDACHQRGMAVILDVVYNHATGAHPFAKLYWNASKNETAANNPWFNVTAPHPYSVFHDFNHESPLVRDFVKQNLTFLLEEYNIDGFRFDLAKGFTQKSSSESTASNYDASRIAILKDYNTTIKSVKPETYVILEHFCDDREETELSNAGMMVWRNLNYAFCQSAMGYSSDSDFSRLYYDTSSRPANSLVSYMESHDEERAAYKQVAYGLDYLKTNLAARMSQLSTNAAFFFIVPGPKMIWQFGELGYDFSINSDMNGNINNDNRTSKKPIKWEYLDKPERKQLHDTYVKLMALRNNHPELFTPSATLNWKVTTTNWDSGRFLTLTGPGNKQLVVVGNFNNNAGSYTTTFPATGEWYNYMNVSDTLRVNTQTMSIAVPANNFKMYTSFSTVGKD